MSEFGTLHGLLVKDNKRVYNIIDNVTREPMLQEKDLTLKQQLNSVRLLNAELVKTCL